MAEGVKKSSLVQPIEERLLFFSDAESASSAAPAEVEKIEEDDDTAALMPASSHYASTSTKLTLSTPKGPHHPTLNSARTAATLSDFGVSTASRISSAVAAILRLLANPMAPDATLAAKAWAFDLLPTLVGSLVAGIQAVKERGKEGRKFKILTTFVGTAALLLGIGALIILGALGFAVSYVILPFLVIGVYATALIRMIRRWVRAFKGKHDPEELLAQKIEKTRLSHQVSPDREKNFCKQALFLDWYLRSKLSSVEKPVSEQDVDDDLKAYRIKKADIAPTLHEHHFDEILKEEPFKGDYIAFFNWLKEQSDRTETERDPRFSEYNQLATNKALSLIEAEHNKLVWRTIFLIIILAFVLAASVGALAGMLPIFLPALAGTFALIGAVAGGVSVLACIAASVVVGISAYKQYQGFKSENKDNPQFVKELRAGIALQLTGSGVLLLSTIAVGGVLLCIPLANLALIAGIGAAAVVMGFSFLIAGVYKAAVARKKANEALISSPKTPTPPASSPAESSSQKVADAPEPSHKNQQTLGHPHEHGPFDRGTGKSKKSSNSAPQRPHTQPGDPHHQKH